MAFNTMHSSGNTGCVDFIIVSNRNILMIEKIFREAAAAPDVWSNHHFYVVYDSEEECKKLKNWVEQAREFMTLPQITTVLAAPENIKNVTALRAQALQQGNNPYVYFQDDDDPLPSGLERRMKMMESHHWQAIYGITKTVSMRGQVIEEFPTLLQDDFICEPVKASRIFPTYAHPLAALFKRTLFNKVPLNDGKRYQMSGSNAFALRLFASGVQLHFLPDVIRTVRHHAGNNNGILASDEAHKLAMDIETWMPLLEDPAVQTFHSNIAKGLKSGTITTYREIDGHIEAFLEGERFF